MILAVPLLYDNMSIRGIWDAHRLIHGDGLFRHAETRDEEAQNNFSDHGSIRSGFLLQDVPVRPR